jgi:hypothetical protein
MDLDWDDTCSKYSVNSVMNVAWVTGFLQNMAVYKCKIKQLNKNKTKQKTHNLFLFYDCLNYYSAKPLQISQLTLRLSLNIACFTLPWPPVTLFSPLNVSIMLWSKNTFVTLYVFQFSDCYLSINQLTNNFLLLKDTAVCCFLMQMIVWLCVCAVIFKRW